MLKSLPLAARIENKNLGAPPAQIEVNAKVIPLWERLWDQGAVRKTFVLVVLGLIWQLYAQWLDNPLMLPTFVDTLRALVRGIASGVIIDRTVRSLYVLGLGFGAGISLAAVFTALAITTRIGTDFLEALTSMFNPLPSIALLPLALIWFGLGAPSLVFVLNSCRVMGGRAEHAFRLPGCITNPENGRAQLRTERHPFHRIDTGAGRVSQHPHGIKDWVGICLADAHRRRNGFWQQRKYGRTWLVHLREQEFSSTHPRCLPDCFVSSSSAWSSRIVFFDRSKFTRSADGACIANSRAPIFAKAVPKRVGGA